MLNFIEQIVYHTITKAFDIAVTKAFDEKHGPDHCRPACINKDPSSNVQDIPKKNRRPENIRFFDLDCKKPGPIVIINRQIYYQNAYSFVDQLKDIALLGSLEKTQFILLQLLQGSAWI